MGKKNKAGKQRKDKFYHLAKETGFRARSAFKLIQLNRKFEFLQKSRVLIDLCAAPGGWLQVARESMPVSSLIIGVDLYPIKAIPNVITLQEDITTDKCRQTLRKEMKTWDADVVLHDGAPNVGKNWLHDAFQQSQLTLSALKLATKFLRKGGWFVTKVFRSKDYHSLLFVLKKLFKKVYSTKPQASRKESAEIFVVCQNYLAPSKIDPKFLDEKYVFEELESEGKKTVNLFKPQKDKKKKAEGYPDGGSSVRNILKVSDYIQEDNYLELLSKATEIEIDEEWIKDHPSTTNEIVECCKDIKVLGRPELKALIGWRKTLIATFMKQKEDKENSTEKKEDVDEEEEIDKQIALLKAEEEKDLKKKKKKVAKEKKKLVERLNLKMTLKNDEPIVAEDVSIFNLKEIKTREGIEELVEQSADVVLDDDAVDSDVELRPRYEKYNKFTEHLDDSGRFYKKDDDESDEDEEDDDEFDSEEELSKEGLALGDNEGDVTPVEEEDEEQEEIDDNPLIVDMEESGKDAKRRKRAEIWFDRDIFQNVEEDADEEFELDALTSQYSKQGGKIFSKKESDVESGYTSDSKIEGNEQVIEQTIKKDSDEAENVPDHVAEDIDSDTSDSELEEEMAQEKGRGKKRKKGKLDAHSLALGTMMIKSKKAKRDIIDAGWNRYAFNDVGLPDWFVKDEEKHCRRPPEVDPTILDEVQNRLKEVNVRTVKKVVEAKARKKKRQMKRMEKVRKKAESICDSVDMSEKEKVHTIRQLYNKANPKKKEVKYIVASKKNLSGKRLARPPGVKGPYKVVDPRMKKDMRNKKIREKKGKKKPGRRRNK